MNTVAYSMHESDTNTRMFSDDSTLVKCRTCGYRLDFFAHNPQYKLLRHKYDFYGTLDGQTIVSKAFKTFCIDRRYSGLKFLTFDRDENHFHLLVYNEVEFDAKRRKTRFERFCEECGNYACVVGATPAYLKIDEALGEGIYRTDILFACGNEKRPLFLVSPTTKELMEIAGLKIRFSPAEGL